MADLPTVQNPDFWSINRNIGCLVNCIGERYGKLRVDYAPLAASSQKFYIDVRNPVNLPVQFAKSVAQVEKTLTQGYDVVVHCRETFHRAPAVWAGYCTRLCGVNYQAAILLIRPFSCL